MTTTTTTKKNNDDDDEQKKEKGTKQKRRQNHAKQSPLVETHPPTPLIKFHPEGAQGSTNPHGRGKALLAQGLEQPSVMPVLYQLERGVCWKTVY